MRVFFNEKEFFFLHALSALFIYGCAGSPLLRGLSLVEASWGYSLVAVQAYGCGHVRWLSLVAGHRL